MAMERILTPDELKEFEDDNFPFENIAFEGGGSKGGAHIGAVRVLEEIGVWKNMKRFSGTSAGAMVALCGALGFNSYEMEEKMAEDTSSKMFDAFMKYLSFLPNMVWHFGMNPGKKMENWIGTILQEYLGSADATFEDLYKKNKRELCVVVSNLSQLDCLYCHVKTTPAMSIKKAIRMSISLPGVLFPVLYHSQYFCDGGLIHNFPIRVYDGWYLSMKPEHNFLIQIPELTNVATAWDPNCQFGLEANPKSIGVLLYSADEKEMFKEQLDTRANDFVPEPTPHPETKLARDRKEKEDRINAVRKQHQDLANAMTAFIKLLNNHTDVKKDTIPRDALERALDQAGDELTEEQRVILFGEGKTNAEIVNSIDADDDGQITMRELTKYAESRGIEVRNVYRGFVGKDITDIKGYFSSILDLLMLNSKRTFFDRFDLVRTIGVDTGYLGTLDLEMEEGDRDYMLKQGKRGCIAFLRYYKSKQSDAE